MHDDLFFIIAAAVSIMMVVAVFQSTGGLARWKREGFIDPLVDSLPNNDARRAELGRYLAADALPAGAKPAAPWARDSVAFRDALLRRLQPQGAFTIAQLRVLPAADSRRASATRTEAVILDPPRLLGFHVYNDWVEVDGRLLITVTDVRGTVAADVLSKKEVDWAGSGGALAAAFDETRPISTGEASLTRTCSRLKR